MSRGIEFPTILHVRPAKTHLRSLIRYSAGHSVGSQGSKAFSGEERSASAQADPSLRWAHLEYYRKCCASAYILRVQYINLMLLIIP